MERAYLWKNSFPLSHPFCLPTPLKIDMEPKNHQSDFRKIRFQTSMYGFKMLIFQGVTTIFKASDSESKDCRLDFEKVCYSDTVGQNLVALEDGFKQNTVNEDD